MRPTKLKRTPKQRAIVQTILKAADDGKLYTLPELHAALPYKCAYGSMRTSLRFLEAGGVILREKAGHFTLIRPTSLAYALFRK